jgi:hypothetical protein
MSKCHYSLENWDRVQLYNHAEFQHTYIYFINTVNSYKFRSQECPANQLLEDFFVQDERFFKPIMVERILSDAFQECVAYLLVMRSMFLISETGMHDWNHQQSCC